MTFLNASLLGWIVPLVGVPWIIHLLNKRFPKTFRFPTVAHIKKSLAQRSRLFRLRHLILALVRTLAVALLVLMFLKPMREMFGSHAHRNGPRRVVLLFDHSLSMEARDGGVSARKRGVIEAEKIINTLAPDDTLDAVAVERNPSLCFPDLTTSQGEVLGFLYNLTPGSGSADFSKAVASAADLLGKEGAGNREVYVLSDFQRTGWATVDLTPLPEGVRVFFVNVAPDARQNHAIIGARFEPGAALAGGAAKVETTVGNYADAPFEGKLEARVDGKIGYETMVAVAPWMTATVALSMPLGGEGVHSLELRLPEDDLPQDDHYYLTASVAEKETVAVVSDEPGGEKHAAFFLSKALDPYEGKGGTVRVRHLTSPQITGAELAATKKIFLTSLDLLPEPSCALLARFVHDGGSIVYFLDGKSDAENLAALDKAGGGSLAPLRLESRQNFNAKSAAARQKARDAVNTGQTIPGGMLQILRGDFKSKYLRLFRGAHRGDLALMEFYDFYRATPTGHGSALLTYSDGSPALGMAGEGLGTLLACNFSVNELSSNMARQRAFPAWVQDLVKTLGSEGDDPEKGNEVGDTIQAEVWKTDMPGNSVLSPAGQPVRTDRELDVNRYRLSFAATDPGVYRLAEAGSPYAWAVNCPPDESDLRAVDTDLLRQRVSGGAGAANFVEGTRDYELLNKGRPLFQYFALGLLALLALELGLFKLFKRLAA